MADQEKSREFALLLNAIEEGFQTPAWHGPNLKASLQGIGPEEAVWRPTPERHNIQELIVHSAYWKHAVRNRVGGQQAPFPERGSDWFKRESPDPASLAADLELLEREHLALRQTVDSMPRQRIEDVISSDHGTIGRNILGVAFHDVYHAGQIMILRKLYAETFRQDGK